jgi:hypothetical protein
VSRRNRRQRGILCAVQAVFLAGSITYISATRLGHQLAPEFTGERTRPTCQLVCTSGRPSVSSGAHQRKICPEAMRTWSSLKTDRRPDMHPLEKRETSRP